MADPNPDLPKTFDHATGPNISNEREELPAVASSSDSQLFPEYNSDQFKNMVEIGEGGFSKVYRCYHEALGEVAIKELNKSILPREFREAFLLKEKAHHQNIIRIFGILKVPNLGLFTSLGLIMEYMKIGSLQKVIHDTNVSYNADQIYRWIFFISSGLNYLHKEGIIHRDIKPGNILLGRSYNDLRISDFGIARKLNSAMTPLLGTFIYMAPETINEQPYRKPVDVYSLTITIWEMIYRIYPYGGIPHYQIAQKILDGTRPKMDKCSLLTYGISEIEHLLKRGWDEDPEKRPEINEFLNFAKQMVPNVNCDELDTVVKSAVNNYPAEAKATFELLTKTGKSVTNLLSDAVSAGFTEKFSRIVGSIDNPDLCQEDALEALNFFKNGIHTLRAQDIDKQFNALLLYGEPLDLNQFMLDFENDTHYNSIILLGGWHDSLTNNVYVYRNNKEKQMQICQSKLPIKLSEHGAVCLDKELYYFGGKSEDSSESFKHCYKLVRNNSWIKMADMNEKRSCIQSSSLVFQSSIWVIGGWDGEKQLASVERYDPQMNIWSHMPEINLKRSSAAASVISGKIYLSGGYNGKNAMSSVEVYDPDTKKWEVFCDLPFKINKHCSVAEDTNLIIIGGMRADNTVSDEVWKIDIMNPKKEWIQMPSLIQKRYNHAAVKIKNGILVIGGAISNTNLLKVVEMFDGTKWNKRSILPENYGIFAYVPIKNQ